MELLRDPVWQFIGAVLAFVAIGVSLIIAIMQQRKKSLAYEVLTNTPLLTVNDELKGKTKILFEDKPVQNVHLLVLHIINDGNLPLETSDFETPFVIHFSDFTKILSVELVKAIPKGLKPKYKVNPSSIEIRPMLFNSMDGFLMRFLLSEFDGTMHIDGRIKGVKEIHETSFAASTERLNKLGFLCAIGGLISIFAALFSFSGWIVGVAAGLIALTFILDANLKKRKDHISFNVPEKASKT